MTKKPASPVPKLHAGQCVKALRERYAPPEWAFFEQVANGTGYADRERRWADAVAIGIWPSRGLLIHGFEIKVSRSDWKSELAKPDKSEAIQQFCDHWWVVAPRGLIDPAEMPPTWGLVEVNEKGKPNTRVNAPKLDATTPSKLFMAAIFRRHSHIWEAVLKRDCADARDEGEKRGDPKLADRLEELQRKYDALHTKVEEFQSASGVSIEWGWDLGDVGKAVMRLRDADKRDELVQQLERDLQAYDHRREQLKADIAAIRAVETPVVKKAGAA